MNLTVQIIATSETFNLQTENDIEVIQDDLNNITALTLAGEKKPSIILLDYEVQKENTALYIESLSIESPESKIILLGTELTDEIILNCLIKGIYGYLERKLVEQQLVKAIRAVDQGEAWISRRIIGLLNEKFND